MRLPSWLRFRRSLTTALVGAALVGFVTANLGLPLIVPVEQTASTDAGGATKDKSVPFPCQDRPCGCLSADACMRSCCCFTAEERLAWFQARNITPIPELVAAAKAMGHNANEHKTKEHTHAGDACAHCAKDETKTEPKPAPRDCCAAKKSTTASGERQVDCASSTVDEFSHAAPERKGWRVVVVVGSIAAHCHGMGPWSLTGIVAIPLMAEVGYTFDWTRAADVSTFAPRLLSAIHSPPTRPPSA